MIPGRRNLPVPSITRAPAGAFRFGPTAAIFPFRKSTSVFVSVPCETVSTVAFLIKVACDASRVCALAAKQSEAIRAAIDNRFFISTTPEEGILSTNRILDGQILPENFEDRSEERRVGKECRSRW